MKQKQISFHYDRFVDARTFKFQECACLHQHLQVNLLRGGKNHRPPPGAQPPKKKNLLLNIVYRVRRQKLYLHNGTAE